MLRRRNTQVCSESPPRGPHGPGARQARPSARGPPTRGVRVLPSRVHPGSRESKTSYTNAGVENCGALLNIQSRRITCYQKGTQNFVVDT